MFLSRRLFTWSKRLSSCQRHEASEHGESMSRAYSACSCPPLLLGGYGGPPPENLEFLECRRSNLRPSWGNLYTIIYMEMGHFLYFYMTFFTWIHCERMHVLHRIKKFSFFLWVVGLADGAGKLPVPRHPATFAYSRARACSACSRCGSGWLYFSSIFHF